jgi:hypothetical protein
MLKDKGISVTGREGPYVCETSRLPSFLDNRFTDGGEVAAYQHNTISPQAYIFQPPR